MTDEPPPALTVTDLVTEFRTRRGNLRAVDGVSFSVAPGEVLAVIGESGSGKSAMLRSILGIQPRGTLVTGSVRFGEREVLGLAEKDRARTRGRDASMVFQDPLTALDPVHTVGQQLGETVRRHTRCSAAQARRRSLELLDLVQIPSPAERLRAYPAELSGGMRQRVVIAMAIAGDPDVLLADEPTTALDVTVQARVISLFRQVQRERGMGVVVVTHDLGVAAELADQVAVMYGGRVVEHGSARDVLRDPTHPYTEGLLAANVRPGQRERPQPIPGSPPSLKALPPGCAFAPRCHRVQTACWEHPVALHPVGAGRSSRCVLVQAPAELEVARGA
jgi:oligopeptide/dipeptide ABC transporter ATP-binding protein